jgi:hypothetical protein
MASPPGIVRSLWRKTRRAVYLVRHADEDTEALYGPNPNKIPPEEKMRHVGGGVGSFGGGGGYGGTGGT